MLEAVPKARDHALMALAGLMELVAKTDYVDKPAIIRPEVHLVHLVCQQCGTTMKTCKSNIPMINYQTQAHLDGKTSTTGVEEITAGLFSLPAESIKYAEIGNALNELHRTVDFVSKLKPDETGYIQDLTRATDFEKRLIEKGKALLEDDRKLGLVK